MHNHPGRRFELSKTCEKRTSLKENKNRDSMSLTLFYFAGTMTLFDFLWLIAFLVYFFSALISLHKSYLLASKLRSINRCSGFYGYLLCQKLLCAEVQFYSDKIKYVGLEASVWPINRDRV